ncbi:transmembrane amino acid transporter-like protein [Trichoderma citrinoviride]|uniref:Transmembrane amino acid transporter-like protein n=1 Tax=Trichoderma citrinoviride TaxID=58853 RepID=A0A2T4BBB9_9HYPO|nr:transmembrane amino acid transporter-like protein [Trichoderma citrinoviride]PTB66578.1 transmembrane amino acid transporter-like protein [Trichoderma citrinoviride]
MAPPSRNNPSTWDQYDGMPSPTGSVSSSPFAEDRPLLDDADDADDGGAHPGGRDIDGGRRPAVRPSVTDRLAAMADVGGVNSFRRFARSWQRAAAFPEVLPRRPSLVFAPGQDQQQHQMAGGGDDADFSTSHDGFGAAGESPRMGSPLAAGSSNNVADSHHGRHGGEGKPVVDEEMVVPGVSANSSIFGTSPYLATQSIIGSYGSYHSGGYGTMGGPSVVRRRPSIIRTAAGQAAEDEVVAVVEEEDAAYGEEQPILVKEVKQGNKVVLTVDGQSTLPQSIFNSINALIGIGLLSLPLAFSMSGWILGLSILTLTAAVTSHTANLLAKCMQYDASLITYSDLAYISFGARARIIVSALFTLELVAACVALFILFSDSLALLLPGMASVEAWKCICAAIVLVLNSMPLRWLSYTSVIGIFSTFCIVCVVIADGLLKTETPGSLWEPAATHLLPKNWLAVPLAYGLMLSPWGAHSVFPSIYRDMRHPHKWGRAVGITFSFSYVLDTCLAIVGILMFGDGISDAITSNILKSSGFPEGLTIFMCICVTVIPLTKIPLNARPLITTGDVLCGLHAPPPHLQQSSSSAGFIFTCQRLLVRIAVVLVLLFISIVFPAFDSVCAFLGAALCSLIAIVLPIAFYLKLYAKDVAPRERFVLRCLLVVFSVLGLVGTVWTFLPKDLIGV